MNDRSQAASSRLQILKVEDTTHVCVKQRSVGRAGIPGGEDTSSKTKEGVSNLRIYRIYDVNKNATKEVVYMTLKNKARR